MSVCLYPAVLTIYQGALTVKEYTHYPGVLNIQARSTSYPGVLPIPEYFPSRSTYYIQEYLLYPGVLTVQEYLLFRSFAACKSSHDLTNMGMSSYWPLSQNGSFPKPLQLLSLRSSFLESRGRD